MNHRTSITTLLLIGSLLAVSGLPAQEMAPPPQERVVDLAICLDISGSMNGLLNAARTRLWAIVNDLALAKPTPRLRVALLTFGHQTHPAEAGWVMVQTGFTEDLDLVSQKLFALSTNGGTELVGRVLQKSLDALEWSASKDALKLICVAGNESADQDKEVPFRDVCRKAIARGIMINSIYCGNAADQIAPAWREVATLADGHFASIDQNQNVAIATPFDQELNALSASLNTTYIPLGAEGKKGQANQQEQDRNAQTAGAPAAAGRAMAKSGKLYRNRWDLVDASKAEDFKLEEVKEADLPEEMQKMSIEERKAHVAQVSAKRAEIQKKIQEISKKRDEHVAKERARLADEGARSFDDAVRASIRAQAKTKGFEFEK